jgi:phosphoribosyl-AMP cyclohydrolase
MKLKFDEKGLIPAIIQEYKTKDVLMMAFMNEESVRRTLETGTTWFWSRSRNEYWNKGATSGNVQKVKKVLYDCDDDTLLILVDQVGEGACHTGNRTCFFREIPFEEKEIACPA